MSLRFFFKLFSVLLLGSSLISCTPLNTTRYRNSQTTVKNVTAENVAVQDIKKKNATVTNKKPEKEVINTRATDNNQYVITSVGYASIAAQKGDSFDLQMLNAIKVSKLEAYKELAEQLHGVLVSAENNVIDSRLQDDLIKSRVRGLVRGASVLRSYHQGDVYITELELDMHNSPFSTF